MRRGWIGCLLVTSACHAAPAPPPLAPYLAGGTIQGTVTDEAGNRVPLAEIVVEESPLKVTSDPDGLFAFSGLAPGERWLVVRHDQYLPLRVPADVQGQKSLTLTLRLSPLVEVPFPENEGDPTND